MGLPEYLVFCKDSLDRLLDFDVVHVVMCNEACDLDSAVAALAYGFFLHETSTAPFGSSLFLPLLDIKRNDFPLRTEITYFLGKYGITSSDLIFKDDLDLMEVKVATNLKLTLVDHHVLSASMSAFEESVVQIIDHRLKDGNLPDRVESRLEMVGSCCTLVTEALLEDEGFSLDEVTAALLHGAIITDTVNFSPAAGKTTPKDVEMVEKLEVFLPPGVENDTVFREIKEAKFDLSGLTTEEILMKDLKFVHGDSLMVAMSSVTMAMSAFSAREDFLDSLRRFAVDRKVDAVVVLTVCVGDDGSVSRQLGIFSPSRVYREQMKDVLSASQSPHLGLSPLPSSHEEFLAFTQSSVSASRKQILPIIKGFLAGETTPDENQSFSDVPNEQAEGFSSLGSLICSRQSTSEGEITSEDLISRGDSYEQDFSLEDVLPSSEKKPFDPLSSVHSSDSVSSPTDFVKEDKTVTGDGASNKKVIVGAELDSNPFWNGSVKSPGVPKEADDSFETNVHFVGGADIEDEEDVEVGSGSRNSDGGDGSTDNLFTSVQDAAGNSSSPSCPQPDSPHFQTPQPAAALDAFCVPPICTQESQRTGPTLHNGLTDDLDLDPLSHAAPHEVLFPADSPADFSAATSGQTSGQASGQTSGHGSKASSYPVTPPNSYMELEFGAGPKETHLPSFNSSEMVEKIQEKKAAMEAGAGEDNSLLEVLSPFTPANSYVESSFSANYAKETQLPSFHSSDMVERIREKRTSMEREVGYGTDSDREFLDVEKSPFTPHNSYVEGSFDKYARENLPSLNSAEIASRIKQRQAEMAAASADLELGTASPGESSPRGGRADSVGSPVQPYTPQNSYRDSPLITLGAGTHITDLNEVAERLSLTGSESSSSLGEPKPVMASNKVHLQGVGQGGDQPQSFEEEETDMVRLSPRRSPAEGMEDSGDEGEKLVGGDGEEVPVPRRGVKFAEQDSDFEDEDDEDSAALESAIQKIAYDLANEMIQKALETFPSESVKELVPEREGSMKSQPSISEDSSPTMDISDRELASPPSGFLQRRSASCSPEKEFGGYAEHLQGGELAGYGQEVSPKHVGAEAAGFREDVKHADSLADEEKGDGDRDMDYAVETEYLRDMDQRVNRYSRESNVIETDADKEVVESSSFRKISGQENQTVQEEILQQIQQEALERKRSQMRQSSVAEEESGEENSSGDGGEISPTVAPDSDRNSFEKQVEVIGEESRDHSSDERTKPELAGRTDVPEDNSFDEGARETGPKGEVVFDDPLGAMVTSPVFGAAPSNLASKKHEDSLGSNDQSLPEPKKKVMPELDVSLDDSLTGEDGKKIIHVVRDRELYASALENESASGFYDAEHVPPKEVSDSVLDTSATEEEEDRRRKVGVVGLDNSSFLEEEHRYESFMDSGSGSLAMAESEEVAQGAEPLGEQMDVGAKHVERSVSASSDTSLAASQKGDRLKGVELTDEWQDDELPSVVGAEGSDLAERPPTLGIASNDSKKRLVPESGLVPQGDDEGDDLRDVPVVDSDSEFDSDMDNDQLEWETKKLLGEDDTPVQMRNERETIPEYTAEEERRESRLWKVVRVGDGDFQLDMKVIEPYKRVLSHGGYIGDGLNAMIVFSGCYLPSKDRKDYSYVMDHLFNYVIHTLDELVADDYMIVYFHGATPRRQMPSFGWLKRCYQCIDRKLKKNLKALYLVHPTLWLKTIVLMTRPFISTKFSSKLQFVRTLDDLKRLIPMEYVYVPEQVKSYDNRHFHPSPPSTPSSNQ